MSSALVLYFLPNDPVHVTSPTTYFRSKIATLLFSSSIRIEKEKKKLRNGPAAH